MKIEHKKTLRICSYVIFGVYIILLLYFLFLAESTGRTCEERSYHYNLILFREIRRFWVHRKSLGTMAVVLNLLGNIAAFVPFGAMLPMIHSRFRSLLYMTLLTFEFSLIVELIQLVAKVGSFDVDDLLLNTIGGILGYLIFYIFHKIGRHKIEKASKNI